MNEPRSREFAIVLGILMTYKRRMRLLG